VPVPVPVAVVAAFVDDDDDLELVELAVVPVPPDPPVPLELFPQPNIAATTSAPHPSIQFVFISPPTWGGARHHEPRILQERFQSWL
jgi:hypothetical protein